MLRLLTVPVLCLLSSSALANTVAITEYLNNTSPAPGDENTDEWVELYNYGDSMVDLTGWSLDDEDSDRGPLPAGVQIPPGGYVILAKSAARFVEIWGVGEVGVDVFSVNLVLSNTSDELVLKDAAGVVVAEVAYPDGEDERYAVHFYGYYPGEQTLWGTKLVPGIDHDAADPAGLLPGTVGYESGLDTADGAAFTSTTGDIGSPLTGIYWPPASSPTTLAITEVFTSSINLSGYTGDWVELFNYGSAPVNLGGMILRDGTTRSDELVLPSYVLPSGGYAVITLDPVAFADTWLGGVASPAVLTGELSLGANGAIELWDGAGRVSSVGWRSGAAPAGASGQRTVGDFPEAVHGEVGRWFASFDEGDVHGGAEDWASSALVPTGFEVMAGDDVGSPLAGPYEALTPPGPVLTVSGACPGVVSIEVSGLTPRGQFALVTGSAPGAAPLPGGPCAGESSGLAGGLALRALLTADGAGEGSLRPSLPGGACGLFLTVVDLSTCAVTAPSRL